jgi:hypothetical protein
VIVRWSVAGSTVHEVLNRRPWQRTKPQKKGTPHFLNFHVKYPPSVLRFHFGDGYAIIAVSCLQLCFLAYAFSET